MENIILIGILLVLIATVAGYLLHRKKCGGGCACCPHAGKCPTSGGE